MKWRDALINLNKTSTFDIHEKAKLLISTAEYYYDTVLSQSPSTFQDLVKSFNKTQKDCELSYNGVNFMYIKPYMSKRDLIKCNDDFKIDRDLNRFFYDVRNNLYQLTLNSSPSFIIGLGKNLGTGTSFYNKGAVQDVDLNPSTDIAFQQDLIMDVDSAATYSSNVLCKEFQNSKILELLYIADCNILYKFCTHLKEIL